MKLTLVRLASGKDSTVGFQLINGIYQCVIIEDEHRNKKIAGETRIWAGTYPIRLRTEGGHHARYSQMFPEFHKGMLEIYNVPKFQYILFHIGNDDDDTDGCLLTNNGFNKNSNGEFVGQSSKLAYIDFYKRVAPVVASGEPTHITIIDFDQATKKLVV